MKKIFFLLATISLSLFVILIVGELLVRFLNPQPSLYPRYKFSEEYGAILFDSTTMIHKKPGHFKFSYKINEWGYRGKSIPISNEYEKSNIVILGDSYAFGTGVNDGEEFPAIIQSELEQEYDVINLSVPGYGLTQQIRRFYEFGRLYDPKIVILQFCSNDPADNIFNRVTEVDDGKFIFKKTNNTLAWIKIHLSHSVLQKSQLYNFFRSRIFESLRKKKVIDARIELEEIRTEYKTNSEELFYGDLLDVFAKDLAKKGVRLMMISVNGELEKFPSIISKLKVLQEEGVLKYFDVREWFLGITDFGSPEGHVWGIKAHKLLGQNLGKVIRSEDRDDRRSN
jgi:hypothetical protein